MKLQRRKFLKVCTAAMAALLTNRLGASSLPVGTSTAVKPNIFFILADDLGYGDVRCLNPEHGKIATPNMDPLAAQGMTFGERLTVARLLKQSGYAAAITRPSQSGTHAPGPCPLSPRSHTRDLPKGL